MQDRTKERMFLSQEHHYSRCVDDKLACELVPGWIVELGISQEDVTT